MGMEGGVMELFKNNKNHFNNHHNNHKLETNNHVHHRSNHGHHLRHHHHHHHHDNGTTPSPLCTPNYSVSKGSGNQASCCHGNLTKNCSFNQSQRSNGSPCSMTTRIGSGNSPSQVPCGVTGKVCISGGKTRCNSKCNNGILRHRGSSTSKSVHDRLAGDNLLYSGNNTIQCRSLSTNGSTFVNNNNNNNSSSNSDIPAKSICISNNHSKSLLAKTSLLPPPHRNGLFLSVDAHCSGISTKLGSSTGGSTMPGCMGPPPISPDTSRSCTPPASTTSSTHTASDYGKKGPDTTTCHWSKCNVELKEVDLMDHIRTNHVDTQVKPGDDTQEDATFRCLWVGCKVYDKPSCSQSWLERHVLCHLGDKPFRCIVDGCGIRFTTQGALERHVNSHFNTYQSQNMKTQRSRDDTPSKLLKKRKLKRKKSWHCEYSQTSLTMHAQ